MGSVLLQVKVDGDDVIVKADKKVSKAASELMMSSLYHPPSLPFSLSLSPPPPSLPPSLLPPPYLPPSKVLANTRRVRRAVLAAPEEDKRTFLVVGGGEDGLGKGVGEGAWWERGGRLVGGMKWRRG